MSVKELRKILGKDAETLDEHNLSPLYSVIPPKNDSNEPSLSPLVLLSGLDSKKYQSILRFKHGLKENSELFVAPILSENTTDNNREIDKFGEIAATKVNDRRKNFSQEQIDAIVRLRKSGETLERLADKFDCCDFTIRKILKKYNTQG